MAEGPRSRSQPFRFWMPAGTSGPSRSARRPAALSRQKSQTQTPSQPPTRGTSPPPSPVLSRRPTSARRDSQSPSPTSSQNRHRRSLQSQPRTQIESPSARRAASKTPMPMQTRSGKHKAATQVKSQIQSKSFLFNSQSQSPATKRTQIKPAPDRAIPVEADRNPVQPISEPTKRNIRKEQNVPHVTINSLVQHPLEYYSNSFLQSADKENVKINLEKMEPSQSTADQTMNPTKATEWDLTSKGINEGKLTIIPGKKVEISSIGVDNKFKGPTESSRNNESNAEHNEDNINKPTRYGSNRKEQKFAISTIPLDSLFDGKRAIFKEDIKEGLSRLAQKMSAGYSGQPKNGSSANVITLAGKNNGASMVIGYEGRNLRKTEDVWNEDEKTGFAASINNNIQSINNSAIDDSSCCVGNPGVHLKISNRPMEKLVCEKTAEPRPTERRAPGPILGQRSTHEPRIRRRCLRALFMESSESDPENPRKPQRHGCRFSCEEKKKTKNDNQISIGNTSVQNNGEGTNKA